MESQEELRREAMRRQLAIVKKESVKVEEGHPLYRVSKHRASGSDRMTKLGEHFALPLPSSPAPEELRWACSLCGMVEPLFLPTGRWIKCSCACQRAERQAQRDQEESQAWAKEQRTLCFGGWLGRQWTSDAIVKEMTRKTFASYVRERFPEAYDAARQFAGSPRGNLIFTGEYGTGKTHLASAIANTILESGLICRFASAPQLYESYLETRKQYDQMAHIQLQERLYGCVVLILDDIDKAEPTNDMHRFYFTLFDERYKGRKPTVITTNRYDELGHYIGNAALSRLSRAMRTVEMIGDDYRLEESFDW